MQTRHVLTWLSMVAALLVHASRTTGDSTSAVAFLDDKETLVETIGKFALQNFQNSTALAETCGTPSACSRRVCQPLESDLSDFPLRCETVPKNPDCQGPNNSTCTNILVSRKRGYVRWATDANLQDKSPTCDMKSTICSQRSLDGQIFTTENSSAGFSLQGYLYFGASNGIMRIFPGKESNRSQCNSYAYDLRERPWYVGATAVQKEIVVMLDAGPSMGRNLGLEFSGSQNLFDASQNITLRLLNTLSEYDKISVFTFNGSASSPPAIVGSQVTVNPKDKSALEDLKTKIRELPTVDTSLNQKANLAAALVAARDQFNDDSNNLKVVIIITAGEVVGPEDLQPDLVDSLAARNVTVFTYRLLSVTGNDTVTTNLANASCSLRGSYEESRYDSQNPLGTVQSFYSYVARLRFDKDDHRPYWVPRYSSYSGISDFITVSYPVFNGSFLVGVAGVDILIDNLGAITSEVSNLLQSRNLVQFLAISAPPQFPCNQNRLPSSSCPVALADNPTTTGLCTDRDNNPDTIKVWRDRACCDSCGPPKSDGLSKPSKIGVIIGGIIGGIVVLGLIGLCVFFKIWRRFCSTRRGDDIHPSPRPIDNPDQVHLRDEDYYNKPL